MMRVTAKLIVSGVTLLSLAASGWCCGFVPTMAMPGDETPAVSGHEMSAMPDNPLPDCQRQAAEEGTSLAPCVALCAVAMSAAPSIAPAGLAQIGEPQYPAQPALHSWFIQPDPYPPRV